MPVATRFSFHHGFFYLLLLGFVDGGLVFDFSAAFFYPLIYRLAICILVLVVTGAITIAGPEVAIEGDDLLDLVLDLTDGVLDLTDGVLDLTDGVVD